MTSSAGMATPTADAGSDDRRTVQRKKQIAFGIATTGYANMQRLIAADPRLANGGILPLQPPGCDLPCTKRMWDVLIRKWRRALHMFDHVFIDGVDDRPAGSDDDTGDDAAQKHEAHYEGSLIRDASRNDCGDVIIDEGDCRGTQPSPPRVTLEAVVAAQRRNWVRPEHRDVNVKTSRVRHTRSALLHLRHSGAKSPIPVEEDVRALLRENEPAHHRPFSSTNTANSEKSMETAVGESGAGTTPNSPHSNRSVGDAVMEASRRVASTFFRVRQSGAISSTNFGVKVHVSPAGASASCPQWRGSSGGSPVTPTASGFSAASSPRHGRGRSPSGAAPLDEQ